METCNHMPRMDSRIALEIKDIRVERLQCISEDDAEAGVYTGADGDLGPLDISARILFKRLWESIHGKGSWEASPWVWVISFKRVST